MKDKFRKKGTQVLRTKAKTKAETSEEVQEEVLVEGPMRKETMEIPN